MAENLKDYREKELKTYAAANLLLILLSMGFFDDISDMGRIILGLLNVSAVSAVIFIYMLLLNEIVPADLKARIIWPRKGLPGSRIFTEIRKGKRDARFTQRDVLRKYAYIYEKIDAEPDEKTKRNIENSEWHKLYNRHETEPRVANAHRDFLLFRDMTVMTIWCFAIYLLLSVVIDKEPKAMMSVIFILETVAVWLAARGRGERFVCSVIACDLRRESEEAPPYAGRGQEGEATS